MKLDNEVTVNKIQIQKQLYLILIGIIIAFMFSSDLWEHVERFTRLTKWTHASVLLALYFIFYFYHIIVQSSYLLFSDDSRNIIFRHYFLNPFNNQKKVYEIPKEQFAGYTIKKSLFGLRESISVARKMGAGKAQYPPFSIKTLSDSQKRKLLTALDRYAQ